MKQRCRLSLERSMKAADAAYDEIDNYKKVEVEPGDHQAQASELAATMGAADCECAAQLSALVGRPRRLFFPSHALRRPEST